MNAQESIMANVNSIAELIKSKPTSDVRLKDFEPTYKQLRGIKGLFVGDSWDEIMPQLDNPEWIRVARGDAAYKEYHKLRVKQDKLENLV